MINVHTMKRLKQEGESEKIVICVSLDIFICSKASSNALDIQTFDWRSR